MRELREDTFSGNKNEDAHDHVDQFLNIVSLLNVLGVSQDAVLLRVFPFTLTGAAKRWVDMLTPGAVNAWDLLKKAFTQRYCPPSKTAKQLEDIHNFKQESDESLYQAWEGYNDLLYKCPTHNINSHQKWHDGTSSRNMRSSSDTDGLAAVISDEGSEARDVRTLTREGPTEQVLQTQKPPSPSLAFIKENIDMLRTMIKVHDQQAKTKAMPRRFAYANSDEEAPASQKTPSKSKELTHLRRSRRLEGQSITKEKTRRERSKSRGKLFGHQETSSDSEYEEGSEETYEDLNSPYKKPKPNPFTQRITCFKYHRRAKLPRNIRVYKGNKDPEDHLSIFSVTAEQEEWPMPVWCKMFRQTLGGAVQNWFDDLDPKSVDSFEELSQKLLEEFSQQKRYDKDLIEIHGIKRRQNEGLQAFLNRFKSESSHIKEVPSVLRVSAFMHGHGHPELAKKLNNKIPKMVDEMFERVRAFIRGEVTAGSVELVRPSQWDKGNDRGHNTNDCYQLKKKIKEVVALGKLAHLVKDIRRSNQRNESQGRNNVKFINMIRGAANLKRPFEEERSGLTDKLTFLAIPRNRLTDKPIILEGRIEDHQVRRILVNGGRLNNRPLSNYGRGSKEQDGANGVCNSEMSFTVQRHNRKDQNEKP
ncbi:reverse transcriptase domain-containing protein [Tanacetum coccineum]|uniref:Reverse transcriptase domain-containing protein n=1 Tax=Tanacetum coccineum TaxID=301880 RepID=A0ABQ5HG28_9ASTR